MIVIIVKINKERQDAQGFVTLPIECDYPNLEAVEAALKRGERISGSQLFYDRISKTTSRIRSRRPFIFGASEVRSMAIPEQKFLEPA